METPDLSDARQFFMPDLEPPYNASGDPRMPIKEELGTTCRTGRAMLE
jgi:hypothetical protein